MGGQKLDSHYDHLVIGGGVVGAGIFRDLSLHGENVLLVDKGDFSAQTSQSSSKMLHGGIRYLENFDFALVKEALHEKNLWVKLAPHLTQERMFSIPVYKESKWPLPLVAIGLFLYDLLSFFKNPRFKVRGKKSTLKNLTGLKGDGLRGSGLYSDAIVEDSKLALECIYSSINPKAHAQNYIEVTSVEKTPSVLKVTLNSTLSNESFEITTHNLLFATGPFTDQLMKKLNLPWEEKMIFSKGSHIWLKSDCLELSDPMVLQTADNRVIFVIPQRGAILVGTTEKALNKDTDIFNIKADQEEIDYLINCLKSYFPGADITHSDIIKSFAGVRPLVAQGSKARGKVSRNHKVLKPCDHVYVVIGGKYTTFRVMASDLVKKLFKDLKRPYNPRLSKTPLTKKSVVGMEAPKDLSQNQIQKILDYEMPRTKDDFYTRRLSVIDRENSKVKSPFIH